MLRLLDSVPVRVHACRGAVQHPVGTCGAANPDTRAV